MTRKVGMPPDRISGRIWGFIAKADWGLGLMTLGLVGAIVANFFPLTYDWDVDHELYYAGRLLHGEWLWMQEFHDKLPAVQLVFLLPAWAQSISLWRLESLVCILAAAVVQLRLLPQFVGLEAFAPGRRQQSLWLAVLVWVGWMLAGDGGITVVNPMVASLQLISLLMILHHALHPEVSALRQAVVVLTAGFLGALAISVRPYVLGMSVVGVLLALYWRSGLKGGRGGAAQRLGVAAIWGAIWGAVFLAWGLVLNVLPYALAGRMDLFRAGAGMLATRLNPNAAWVGFVKELRSPPTLAFYATFLMILVLVALGLARLQPRARQFTIMVVAGIGATLVMFGAKHYWAHYSTLLVGPYVLLVLILMVMDGQAGPRISALIRALVKLVAVLAYGIAVWRAEVGVRMPDDAGEFAIIDYMRSDGAKGQDFLAIYDMKPHWMLDQSRHGFPHAANIKHIMLGWWANVPDGMPFFAPKTAAEFCAALDSDGPEIVFDRPKGGRVHCMELPGSPYRLEHSLAGGEVLVYRRQP